MPKPLDAEKQKYMFTDDIKFLQKAVVFHPDQDGLFLALKRSPDSFARPNDWDLPGGNVLFGELHEDSLRKEIAEEANLEVDTFSPVQIITTYDSEKEIYYFFNGFYCRARNNVVKISFEHSEYRWVSKKEFIESKPAQYLVDLVVATFEKL
jgi:8-oxo-dGTP pyrophosphatase MutT (NUDIX family)